MIDYIKTVDTLRALRMSIGREMGDRRADESVHASALIAADHHAQDLIAALVVADTCAQLEADDRALCATLGPRS